MDRQTDILWALDGAKKRNSRQNGLNGQKESFFCCSTIRLIIVSEQSLTNVDSSETTFHKRECQNFWKPDTWQPTNKSRLLKKDTALYKLCHCQKISIMRKSPYICSVYLSKILETRQSILGSDGSTQSECSLSAL